MKRFVIFGLIAALLAALAWWGLPVYRASKERRAATQAQEAFEKKDFRRALLSARQALVLNSNNVAACRVMADLADASRSPHAIVWRARVAEVEPTLKNRILLASCALRYEQPPFVLTTRTLDEIASDGTNDPAFHLVAAQLALKQNRLPAAEQAFEAAIRLEPTNQLHRLNLAVVRLQSPDAQAAAKAREQLETLAANPDLGIFALRSLAIHHLRRDELDLAVSTSSRILRHPQVAFTDQIEHLTILHTAKKPEFEAYLTAIERDAGTNAVHVFELSARLLALKEAERALTWLQGLPETIRAQQPVPMAIANAFAARHDWRGLETFLSGQKWKEQEFLRFAFLARAVREQKDETVARIQWDKAVAVASERPELLSMLAQTASGWGWKKEAEELLWRVVGEFPRERWAIDALHAGYARERNTHGLLALYTLALSRDQATNLLVQNNYAALSLLVGTNTARAHETAAQVYRANPTNHVFASTYAWSLHLKGQTAEALRIMETLDQAKLSHPSLAAYYGVILGAAGQKEKAGEYLSKAERGQLLPEEKLMIAEMRKKL